MVLAFAQRPNHILHLIITLVFLPWLIVWVVLSNRNDNWLCPSCGSLTAQSPRNISAQKTSLWRWFIEAAPATQAPQSAERTSQSSPLALSLPDQTSSINHPSSVWSWPKTGGARALIYLYLAVTAVPVLRAVVSTNRSVEDVALSVFGISVVSAAMSVPLFFHKDLRLLAGRIMVGSLAALVSSFIVLLSR